MDLDTILHGLPGSSSTYGSIFTEGAETLKRDIKTRPVGLDPFTQFQDCGERRTEADLLQSSILVGKLEDNRRQ